MKEINTSEYGRMKKIKGELTISVKTMRITVHTGIGKSPFEINFGRNLPRNMRNI